MEKLVVSRRQKYHHISYAALDVVRSAHIRHSGCRAAASTEARRRISRWRTWRAGGPGGRPGFFPHHPGYGRFGNYGLGFGAWGYPFGDEDESFDFYPEAAMNAPAPAPAPVVVIESRDRPPAPAPVPEAPKLIEVPQAKNPGPASKPDPPALFILTNGERLEARRYMLTADSLHVEIARRQRTISLGQLDLDATIAANRERGIDLKIPADRNEIFLGF